MHEMSIASAILEQVLETAAKAHLRSVTEVRIKVGELRLVVPEALQLAWQAVTRQTIAEHASLKMANVRPLARCGHCGKEYNPEWPFFVCPDCGRAEPEILAGNELILEQIIGEPASADQEAEK